MMRKIIVITQVTLDGVMQAPGGPEEDPSNGFTHGGRAMAFVDDALSQVIGETIAGCLKGELGCASPPGTASCDATEARQPMAAPGMKPPPGAGPPPDGG